MRQLIVLFYITVLVMAVCMSIATALKAGSVLWIALSFFATWRAVRILLLE